MFSEIYKDTGEDVTIMRGSPRAGTVSPQGTVCFMSENPYRICKVRPKTRPQSSTNCWLTYHLICFFDKTFLIPR